MRRNTECLVSARHCSPFQQWALGLWPLGNNHPDSQVRAEQIPAVQRSTETATAHSVMTSKGQAGRAQAMGQIPPNDRHFQCALPSGCWSSS